LGAVESAQYVVVSDHRTAAATHGIGCVSGGFSTRRFSLYFPRAYVMMLADLA